MTVKITDGFLPADKFRYMQNLFMEPGLPWTYVPFILGSGYDDEEQPNMQMVHMFYDHFRPIGDDFMKLSPLLDAIRPKSLVRIKANLTPRTAEPSVAGFHKDTEFSCTTAIYYLNTNNGKTIFEDGTEIESVANRYVEFDSQMKHSGVTHTDEKIRVLININYF